MTAKYYFRAFSFKDIPKSNKLKSLNLFTKNPEENFRRNYYGGRDLEELDDIYLEGKTSFILIGENQYNKYFKISEGDWKGTKLVSDYSEKIKLPNGHGEDIFFEDISQIDERLKDFKESKIRKIVYKSKNLYFLFFIVLVGLTIHFSSFIGFLITIIIAYFWFKNEREKFKTIQNSRN